MAAAEAVVEVEPPEKAGAARHERQLGGGGGGSDRLAGRNAAHARLARAVGGGGGGMMGEQKGRAKVERGGRGGEWAKGAQNVTKGKGVDTVDRASNAGQR